MQSKTNYAGTVATREQQLQEHCLVARSWLKYILSLVVSRHSITLRGWLGNHEKLNWITRAVSYLMHNFRRHFNALLRHERNDLLTELETCRAAEDKEKLSSVLVRVVGSLVASTLTDIFYIARRSIGRAAALQAVELCLPTFAICPC